MACATVHVLAYNVLARISYSIFFFCSEISLVACLLMELWIAYKMLLYFRIRYCQLLHTLYVSSVPSPICFAIK